MGSLTVFDADVLIAHLDADDASHARARDRVRSAVEGGAPRVVSTVNYAELLIWPARRSGPDGVLRVRGALQRLGIAIVPADAALSEEAAAVRARSGLALPDAYAVATALLSGRRGDDVRLESFDERVLAAFGELAR